jgi:hypothetical protein
MDDILPTPDHAQIHQLQRAVLYEINQLNGPRLGVIEMEVDVRVPSMSLPSSFVKQDICRLIQQNKFTNAHIYFLPKYTLDQEGRDALYTDLLRASLLGGDRVTLWGKGNKKSKGQQCMYIRCQCGIIYRGDKIDKVTGKIIERDDYRNTTYSNDRKNQRHGQSGRNASHRTVSDRRLTKDEDACPFSISVFQDKDGFYIKSKLGSVTHQFHPRRDHLRSPVTLLGKDDTQLQSDLNSARAKVGTAANLHYVRTAREGTPTVLSRHQIRQIVKINQTEGGDGNKENGEIDDIYTFLEETGNYYVSLLARGPSCGQDSTTDPAGKNTLFNETRIGPFTGQEDVKVDADEEKEMLRIVEDHRRELKIQDTQEMMVGIAYGMPFELEQFELFHVSMHIDATADSNKEGRPLVTVTSKDSFGHMFFVLRAFLPSEQSWAYKWLFQTVFPALIGKDVLNKINIVVTDGDSQEITQLESAVSKYCPNVYRLRCSWHIIDRGWARHVTVPLGGHSRKKRPVHRKGKVRQKAPPLTECNKTARTIYRWMFSWAQPSYCESEEEYVVSKALFMQFVQSYQVKNLFGQPFIDSVTRFVRENVFTHEDRFCYYHRHGLFHLEIHTNCGHEGTNNGVKNCASPVMPQNRLDGTIKTLNLNADVKAINTQIMVCQKATARKTWTDTPTSEHVTDPCESMLRTEWKAAANWVPYRRSQFKWLVVHEQHNERHRYNDWSDEEDSEDEEDSDVPEQEDVPIDKYGNKFGPIPRFSRIYEVQVKHDPNVFQCTCCHQERMGMPCRHIAAVCLSNDSILGKDPKGFPLSSIRIFWWNKYYHYGLSRESDHKLTRKALLALANDDTKGLPCPGRLDDPWRTYFCPERIIQAFYTPATNRLLNYDCADAMTAVQSMKDRNNPNRFQQLVPAGLSQRSHVRDEDEDEEDVIQLGDWSYPLEELSDTEDYQDSRHVLSRHHNEMCEAFTNSKEKESLEKEFMKVMNSFTVRARGSAAAPPSSSQGHRVSMLPASSKRRKTHGTAHY